ncbi:MAG: GGDEF domain-containing protein [Candidatus Korobacteraceae bacterium]
MQGGTRDGASPEKVAEQLQRLRTRDLQLWSIAFMTMLVLALGIITLILPNVQGPTPIYIEFSYLPQLAAGLIALVVLLNLYLANQRRLGDTKRVELVRDATVQEVLRQAIVVDPITQLLDRRYLEYLLPVEVARANRTGAGFTLMLIEAASMAGIRDRQGSDAANGFAMELARVLKSTFRGSDSILRYDVSQFLVVMPNTNEKQAGIAMQRLVERVDDWNVHTQEPWEMLLECRLSGCQPGEDGWSALRRAEKTLTDDRVPSRKPLEKIPASSVKS